jgi:hypothetical protein
MSEKCGVGGTARFRQNNLRKKMGGMISHPAHHYSLDQVYGRFSTHALRPCVAA